MQPRTLKFKLSDESVVKVLTNGRVGFLATTGEDGPYVIPVNYVLLDGKIYLHGRKAGGQKLDNIRRDPRVCFSVAEVGGYRRGDAACKTSTIYNSVVGRGTARILPDGDPLAEAALLKFAEIFNPKLDRPSINPEKLAVTAVIELTVPEFTGKYNV
ncbi:MAG: pyridoxamine 5'-phosphate oxidase family protein [Deltaproteobacteria bacterium]|jgi:nitroimidazol reductase NimA-like FMN-containing flavoprotein (pyridoxamine 5'-phosphate oxidase superfamily)|nr:pyridoxamine 5'-phosphate oxidase family protein [Deltaproteobacteria bacterium]